MLTTAAPIFERVPASFADPVGLAEQQAPGVVSLIVVQYEPDGSAHDALGPFYDSYVTVSGQLLAVARTTADYRYPVTPSVALSRFIEGREAGRPAFVSVYEVAEDDCARFIETVFFSECLKLHVDGAASAALVAGQIARSGCGNGVLEVNDFSDPEAPRVRLVDLDQLAASIGTGPPPPSAGGGADPEIEPGTVDLGGLTAVLADLLDGVTGRVLLYDRAKNLATVPDRAGKPWDLVAAIEEASRLALARRGTDAEASARSATVAAAELRATAPPDQVERVEGYLRRAADRPHLVTPADPHARGLGALVAELQGRPFAQATATGLPAPVGRLLPSTEGRAATLDAHGADGSVPVAVAAPAPPAVGASAENVGGAAPLAAPVEDRPTPSAEPVPPPLVAPLPVAAAEPSPAPGLTPATTPAPPDPSGRRHPLATELDVLRADVFALFEDAVGREHAVAHEAHVLDEHGIPSPVPSAQTLDYLRALLTDDPPRRWHGFKRARGKTYTVVAAKLLAFHSANGHADDPARRDVLHEVSRLWSRLHQ